MIRSKLPNKEYRDNYDKIFRKKTPENFIDALNQGIDEYLEKRTPRKERGADR
jgi:hypothetical protein